MRIKSRRINPAAWRFRNGVLRPNYSMIPGAYENPKLFFCIFFRKYACIYVFGEGLEKDEKLRTGYTRRDWS